MDKDNLLTVEDFNSLVRQWSQQVKAQSSSTLKSGTHSTGELLSSFNAFTDLDSKTKAIYKVKFGFNRYGVFRAYGVGRGYVRYNGVLQRGFRLKTYSTFKQWQSIVESSLDQGMKSKEINALKAVNIGELKRKPLDWLDSHLTSNLNSLADIVQNYYGDVAAKCVLESLNSLKINKNG